MLEKDLAINDIWESVNGNYFLKISDEYSLALGNMDLNKIELVDLLGCKLTPANDVSPVEKIGSIKIKIIT